MCTKCLELVETQLMPCIVIIIISRGVLSTVQSHCKFKDEEESFSTPIHIHIGMHIKSESYFSTVYNSYNLKIKLLFYLSNYNLKE